MGDFEAAVKQNRLSICPKCQEWPPRVDPVNREWYCRNCSHAWPMVTNTAAPSRIIDMPTDVPHTVGIMRIHPRILP